MWLLYGANTYLKLTTKALDQGQQISLLVSLQLQLFVYWLQFLIKNEKKMIINYIQYLQILFKIHFH